MGSKSAKYRVENGSSIQSRTKTFSPFSSKLNESIPSENLAKEDASLPKMIHQNLLKDTLSEGKTLVWIDTEINNQPSNIDTQIQLKNIINSLRIFDQIEAFEKYITHLDNIHNEKLFVIISTTIALTIIPHLHEHQQVKYIYIYGKTKIDTKISRQLLEKYPKVYH